MAKKQKTKLRVPEDPCDPNPPKQPPVPSPPGPWDKIGGPDPLKWLQVEKKKSVLIR
jgi:hypothetical protein